MRDSLTRRPQSEQIEEALFDFFQLFIQAEVRGAKFCFDNTVLIVE